MENIKKMKVKNNKEYVLCCPIIIKKPVENTKENINDGYSIIFLLY